MQTSWNEMTPEMESALRRQDEAEAEWDAIQDDEESGYDGP